MSILRGVLALLVLASPVWSSTTDPLGPTPRQLTEDYLAAVRDYRDGNYAEAYALGRKIARGLDKTTTTPAFEVRVFKLLGKAARGLGNSKAALAAFTRAHLRVIADAGAESREALQLEAVVDALQAVVDRAEETRE